MTATAQLRSTPVVMQEIIDLLGVKVRAGNTDEEATAIKAVINLLSRVPQKQRIPSRMEIQAHGYTPYQEALVLDSLNWLEGADQPSPSAMFVRLAR